MGDLSTYSLSDFILFAEFSYYRLFELYNQALWPWHVLPVCAGLLLLYLYKAKLAWSGRVIAVVLFISWLWVAWAFLYQRFYQIHVVANGYALGFVVQAVLIAWYGMLQNHFQIPKDHTRSTKTGLALVLIAVFIYPLIAVFTGRDAWSFEMFGLAPDPTVLATFGMLLMVRARWWLYILPVFWSIISGITLLVM